MEIGSRGRKPEPQEGNVAKKDGLRGRLEANTGQVPCRVPFVPFTQPQSYSKSFITVGNQ